MAPDLFHPPKVSALFRPNPCPYPCHDMASCSSLFLLVSSYPNDVPIWSYPPPMASPILYDMSYGAWYPPGMLCILLYGSVCCYGPIHAVYVIL